MEFGAEVFSATTTFCASNFDIGSDLINSLDFLGYNVSRTLSDSLPKSFLLRHNLTSVRMIDETNEADSREIYDVHQIWGALGILIMFLPGLVMIPLALAYLIHGRNAFKETYSELEFDAAASTKSHKYEVLGVIFGVCANLFYPIAMICASFASLSKACRGKGSELQTLSTWMVGHEAFLESFPQILLQCFTIAYGYDVTTVQRVTIIASFFLLARVAIMFDFLWEDKERDFKDTIIHTAKRLPAHVTTIIFRICAFTLTMIFLREWAVITILVLYLEILAISYIRFQSVQDPVQFFRTVWYKSLNNLAVLNVYSPADKQIDKSGEKGRNFIILSTITTFVHHVIVMTSIILLTFYYPEYFQHEKFENLILTPGGDEFFYAFIITYALGISNLILCLHSSKKAMDSMIEVLE